jgi:ABC-type transport system substrate-binding protein
MADIKGLQANLNQTNTMLAKAQSQYDSAMDAARQSLYALDNTNEPTLGDWMPAGQLNGAWINKVNPAHPFNTPKFDSVSYESYSSEDDAIKAFQNKDVNLILSSVGISSASQNKLNNLSPLQTDSSRSLFFLTFNTSNPALGDSALRQALMCMLDSKSLVGQLSDGNAFSFFVLPDDGFWINSNLTLPCNKLDGSARLTQTIQSLKSAGYSWGELPAPSTNGKGFTLPSGKKFPAISLIVASTNEQEGKTANYINQQLSLLGISLNVDSISPEDLRYEVFSSHQYDMAILGWNVSEYPGYLCDWFKAGNPFGYQSDRLQSACEALNSTSDLSAAQKDVYEIQSILAQDPPFIPLYSGITYDAYRNIKYPFDHVLGGLSGVYGAPSLAIPAP